MPHGGMGTVTTRTSEAYYLIGDVLICIICSDLNSDLNTNLKARGGVHTHRRKLFHITLNLRTFHFPASSSF